VDPKEICRKDDLREHTTPGTEWRIVRPASSKEKCIVHVTQSACIALEEKKIPRSGQCTLSAVPLKWTVP